MIETAVIIALINAVVTIIGVIHTGRTSTKTAIINSNARAAQTEQKFADALEAIQKENAETKARLLELKETDSCCVTLQEDVKAIKEEISQMSTSFGQFKAETREANALQMKTNVLQLRHEINEGYRTFSERGSIDKRSKESLLDLGDLYEKDYEGNTFVSDELKELRLMNYSEDIRRKRPWHTGKSGLRKQVSELLKQ